MRAGFVQFNPQLGQIEANLRTIEQLVGSTEADLLVLPELALTGYALPDAATAAKWAEPIPGPSIHRLTDLARTRRAHLVVGLAERADTTLYNSAVLIGPAGLVAVYRKTHLFWDEPDLFMPGNTGFWPVTVGPVKVGMMICFDWVFPEAAGTLARRGAQLLVHPSNLVLPYCQRTMPIRCLENRVFAITCNRWGQETGQDGPLNFSGGSIIAGPTGDVLASAPASENAIKVVEIDVNQANDKLLTPRNHLIDDRRDEFY